MHTDKTLADLNEITEKIIGCAYLVCNQLGAGFVEKVYENALAIELRKASIHYQQQAPFVVKYNQAVVGEFVCDFLVESKVILELKAVKAIDENHLAQCMNYLKAGNMRLGLVINFGKPKVEIKRVILGF